jgi:hypothetical protein
VNNEDLSRVVAIPHEPGRNAKPECRSGPRSVIFEAIAQSRTARLRAEINGDVRLCYVLECLGEHAVRSYDVLQSLSQRYEHGDLPRPLFGQNNNPAKAAVIQSGSSPRQLLSLEQRGLLNHLSIGRQQRGSRFPAQQQDMGVIFILRVPSNVPEPGPVRLCTHGMDIKDLGNHASANAFINYNFSYHLGLAHKVNARENKKIDLWAVCPALVDWSDSVRSISPARRPVSWAIL